MTGQTTTERTNKIIMEHLGVSPEDVRPETLLVPEHDVLGRRKPDSRAHLDCDSLDVVELVMAFEEEFRIEISDDESDKLNDGTVDDCYRLIDSKLAAKLAA